MRAEGGVEVHVLDDVEGKRATTRGLMACGAIWLCPVCSAHIRYVRSVEIAEACMRHLEAGGGVLFVTLTLRHRSDDSLGHLLDGLLKAQRLTLAGAPWKRQVQRLGVVGRIRATEVTDGVNGWHPHSHLLLFTERPLEPVEWVEFDAWLSERWRMMVARQGLRQPDDEHGCVVEPVAHGEGVGQYVAKLQEAASVPLEMTRADLKRGRRGGMMPFELLDLAGTGDARALARWWEYEKATKNRRCIEWSRGLRDLLGIGAEVADADIVAEDVTTDESLLCVLDAEDWRAVCTAGLDARLLEAAEDDGLAGVVEVVADAVKARRML